MNTINKSVLLLNDRYFTCPLALEGEAAASPGFSAAVSSFPAVLENCAPMLLLQQRAQQIPNTEQRATSLFLRIQHLAKERAKSERSKQIQSQRRKLEKKPWKVQVFI